MSQFAEFAAALLALCQQHRVSVAPTEDGGIGVWDLAAGDEPLTGLVDCTEPAPEQEEAAPLPDRFETAIAAARYPGYVGHELSRYMAEQLQAKHPASEVVTIGSSTKVRAWAVVQTRKPT